MKRLRSWSILVIAALLIAAVPVSVAHAAPARPTGLTAMSLGSSSVQLNWTDVGADHYKVYYGTSASSMSPYGTMYTADCAVKSLNCNTRYFFKLRAFSSGGSASPFSATVNARTAVGIAAPEFVSAVASSSSEISLGWPEVFGADGYAVYSAESSSGHFWHLVTTTHPYYNDERLPGNARRYYKVRAINSTGEGYFSPAASARTCPPMVTGLRAVAQGTGGVRLTWNAADGATRYRIYCAESGMTFIQIAETDKRHFTHTAASCSTAYQYKVSAVSASGVGDSSIEVSTVTAPAVPSGLTSQTLSISKIKLTWAAAHGASSYAVYRANFEHGRYTWIASTVDPSYLNEGLTDGKRYYYKVSALNGWYVESAKSAAVSRKTYSVPGTLSKPDFTLFGISPVAGEYLVSFDHAISAAYPTTAEPVFKCYCGSTRSAMLADLPEVKSAVDVMGWDSFQIMVPYGQSMWYGFRVCMGSHSSPMQVLQFTALGTPSSLSIVPFSGGRLNFNWSSLADAARYKVYVSQREPDAANSWSDNKAVLTAAHKLVYKGIVSGTDMDIGGIPNHSTRYYIVVPTDPAGVEGWFFGYRQYRLDY